MDNNLVIKVNIGHNPKQPFNAKGQPNKAYRRFNLYYQGITVGQYRALCLDPANAAFAGKGYAAQDLAWDTKHGFITIGPAAKPAPAPVSGTVQAIAAHVASLPTAPAPAPVAAPKRAGKAA